MKNKKILLGFGMVMPLATMALIISCSNNKNTSEKLNKSKIKILLCSYVESWPDYKRLSLENKENFLSLAYELEKNIINYYAQNKENIQNLFGTTIQQINQMPNQEQVKKIDKELKEFIKYIEDRMGMKGTNGGKLPDQSIYLIYDKMFSIIIKESQDKQVSSLIKEHPFKRNPYAN